MWRVSSAAKNGTSCFNNHRLVAQKGKILCLNPGWTLLCGVCMPWFSPLWPPPKVQKHTLQVNWRFYIASWCEYLCVWLCDPWNKQEGCTLPSSNSIGGIGSSNLLNLLNPEKVQSHRTYGEGGQFQYTLWTDRMLSLLRRSSLIICWQSESRSGELRLPAQASSKHKKKKKKQKKVS